MSTCLVTGYFKIPSKRSNEFYLKVIERFLRSCSTPCVFFSTPDLIHAFKAYENPSIQFVPMEIVELEAWKLGMEFWNRQKQRDPEKYHTVELGALWYEKPHFVRKAIRMLPTYDVYIWVDAGCVRSDVEEIAFREFGKRGKPLQDDRIHIPMFNPLYDKPFYSYPDTSVAAGFMAGTPIAWERHIELYAKIIQNYDKAEVSAISDQYIIRSCISACPGMYKWVQIPMLTKGDRWFWFLEYL